MIQLSLCVRDWMCVFMIRVFVRVFDWMTLLACIRVFACYVRVIRCACLCLYLCVCVSVCVTGCVYLCV